MCSLRFAPGEKPAPSLANLAYGSHERQVLDLWTGPAAAAPVPLIVFIHGGGFVSSDKSVLTSEMLAVLLAQGYAVAAINYRYCGPGNPLPGPMRDAARAVQFLRHRAAEWNLDPGRVALCGGSAGAGIALWLAAHEDLADSASADPVERESSRVRGAFVWHAQTSYDLRFIKRHIGGRLAETELAPVIFQLPREALQTDAAFALFREISPIDHVTRETPPVFLFYDDPKTPLTSDAPVGEGGHHPAFGPPFKEKVESVGGVCVLRHVDDYLADGGGFLTDMVDFLHRVLR